MFSFANLASADDDLIWNYKSDEFVENLTQGKSNVIQDEKQKVLDSELSKNLGIDLVYTNLAECLTVAVDNNYTLKTNNSSKEANYWENKNSIAQFIPDLSYGYTMQQINGTVLVGNVLPTVLNETAIQSQLKINWDTVQQGKLFFLYAKTKHTYKASYAAFEYSRDQVILNTTLTYYDLLQKKLTFEVLKTNLIEREEQLKLTQARYAVGLGDKFDISRAEAELAKAKQQYIANFNSLRLSQAKLANLIGIEVTNAIYPSENGINTRELLEPSYDIETLYKTALDTRDDVREYKEKIKALKAERSSNYMDFVPQLNIFYTTGQYGTIRRGIGDNTTVGFSTTVPLGKNLGLGTFTKVKAYNEKIDAEQYKLINLTRSVKEDILNSYYDSKTALERIEASKKEVRSADSSLRIAIMRMKVGASTFLDVIQAQSLKVQARETLINTMIEYNKAQAQLLFNSGIISIGNVLNGYKIPTPP